jgi:4-amino-4-deoxy-L-arabinose transferase-like glycosyltransferase
VDNAEFRAEIESQNGPGAAMPWRSLAMVLGVLSLLSALLFISTCPTPVFDDLANMRDIQRYAADGVNGSTLAAHVNPAGPAGYIWAAVMGQAIAHLSGLPLLTGARLTVWLGWLVLFIMICIMVRSGRERKGPAIAGAMYATILVAPHSGMSQALLLTEGPAVLFCVAACLFYLRAAENEDQGSMRLWLLCGLLAGIAVIIRQYYLAVLPAFAAAVLFDADPKRGLARRLWRSLLMLAAASIPVAALVLVWGDLTSPGMVSGASYAGYKAKLGIDVLRPLDAALAVSVYSAMVLAPAGIAAARKVPFTIPLLLAIAAAVACAFSRFPDEGPVHSICQLADSVMGHQLMRYAVVIVAVYLLSALALDLEPGELGQLWKDPGFRIASFALLLFIAEQFFVGGNIPFYDRYVMQYMPFIGLLAFRLLRHPRYAALAGYAGMFAISQMMLWRFAVA